MHELDELIIPSISFKVEKKLTNILDSQINVFLDAKTKASRLAEVPPKQLVFLNFQTTLQELHRLLTSNSDIARNLLIMPNTKRPIGVSSCKNHTYDK